MCMFCRVCIGVGRSIFGYSCVSDFAGKIRKDCHGLTWHCQEYSTCDNQLCVEQGTVNSQNWNTRSLGTHILCLPNRVDAELALTDSEKQEIDINAPDV